MDEYNPMIARKYTLITTYPNYDIVDYDCEEFIKDPGAGNLVSVVYGDTIDDMYNEYCENLLYQLYANDTGERVGYGLYHYSDIVEAIWQAERTVRKMPDGSYRVWKDDD